MCRVASSWQPRGLGLRVWSLWLRVLGFGFMVELIALRV